MGKTTATNPVLRSLSEDDLRSAAGGRITNIRAAPGAPSSSLIPQPVVELVPRDPASGLPTGKRMYKPF